MLSCTVLCSPYGTVVTQISRKKIGHDFQGEVKKIQAYKSIQSVGHGNRGGHKNREIWYSR